MNARQPRPRRSPDAILFDVVLIAFSSVLVVNSLGLRPGVGTVPLLVGIPTLVGALVILFMDLFPRMRLPEIPNETGDASSALTLRSLVTAAGAESEDGADAGIEGIERRRQLAFAGWAAAFVILAAFTNFYIAVPVALAGILLAIRLNPIAIVLIVAGTLASFYLLFDLFLGVRL